MNTAVPLAAPQPGVTQFQAGAACADRNFHLRTKAVDGNSLFTAPAAGTLAISQNRNTNVGFQNNHPNWKVANTNPGNNTFGKAGKSGSRNVPLRSRYSF